MRRIIYPLLAGIALLGIVASPALARQHRHASRHHVRIHHHARIRHETFGSADAGAPGPTSSSSLGSSSTPTGFSSDNAGTVSSFTNGVLTIALTNGSMVSGAVTGATEIECRGQMTQADQNPGSDDADNATADEHHGDTSGGDGSSGGDNSTSGEGSNGADNSTSDGNDQGDANDTNDTNDTNDVAMHDCSASDLQRGTVVGEAELTLLGAGATWDKVELLSASSTSGGEDS